MRILHVIPSLAVSDGGTTQAALEMCREILRRGEHAEIYTTNVGGPPDAPLGRPVVVSGVGVTYFPVVGGKYYKFSPRMAAALRAAIPSYDLVHIHSLYQFPSAIAAYHSRCLAVPYVVTPHGSLDPYLHGRHWIRKLLYEAAVERGNLEAAAAVHFTAEQEMELAGSLGLRLHGVTIPHGLEVQERTAGASADAEWPQLAGKSVVLFFGRINFKKGLDLLARAFGQVHRSRSDTHLVIAGPDNEGYAANVRGWLREQDALDAATFTGMVLGERKAALLERADVFVLPSYSENFGITVVEAMAAGAPVVISNKVNIWREVREAGAGLVVNTDSAEIAAAVKRLLDDPDLGKRMGARGRRLARERFSWDTVGDQLIRLYG